ncbi:MAG: UDP-2,4-diacetamido-2,4,6-trideoxy-beta-L-altropyranose hydrolase [Kiritimatiellia bacterium]
MSDANFLIRTDASASIGSGHIMRCIALAEKIHCKGFNVYFLSCSAPDMITGNVKDRGFYYEPLLTYPRGSDQDAIQTAKTADSLKAGWIIFDGYSFNEEYLNIIRKQTPAHVLYVDDYACLAHYPVDILLNQNSSAQQFNYQSDTHTQLLLGSRYTMIRSEFKKYRKPEPEITDNQIKILITMGGSDPSGMSLQTLNAVKKSEQRNIVVKLIAGSMNPMLKEIRETARAFDKSISVIDNSKDMGSLIKWADIVISAAGSTCWEICYLGTPCIVIVTADNQLATADDLARRECAVNLGWHNRLSCAKIASSLENLIGDLALRKRMSHNQRALIDGCGAQRVLEAMCSYTTCPPSRTTF